MFQCGGRVNSLLFDVDELSILKIVEVIIKMIRIIEVNSLFIYNPIYDIFTMCQFLALGLAYI